MRRDLSVARRGALLSVVALSFTLGTCGPARAVEAKGGFFTTSDGVKLHYLEAGKGPAIVFVPGWTMPGWIWEAQIKHFSEQFHVVALDPRSQGESEKTLNGNDATRRARDVKELVDALHLAPAVLVGWSLAVPELLTYAEQYGGEGVRGYVLVDGFAWTKQDPQFVTAMMGLYGQVQTNRQRFTEAFVRNMYRKPQPDQYIQRLVKVSLEMPADSAVAASVSSVGRADYGPALKKIDRPVMVVCEMQLKAMAADPISSLVPTARVELFEDAGHALFVDDAERFNKALEDFVAHLPQAGAKESSGS
jgi:microsomal epoxide hydrolase